MGQENTQIEGLMFGLLTGVVQMAVISLPAGAGLAAAAAAGTVVAAAAAHALP